MARGGFRDVFAGGDVVRADKVDEAITYEHIPSLRAVTGERPKMETFERLLLALSSPWFWACVAYLVKVVESHPLSGRPRQYTVADWVMFWLLSDITKSLRGAEDALIRGTNWLEAQEVVERMGWTHPQWQLSGAAPNRWKYDRFIGRFIDHEQIIELRRILNRCAVTDAETLGQFPATGGSKATLTPDRVVYGDGSELRPMFNAPRKRVDQETGEVTYSRHDSEAIAHHHHIWHEDPNTGEVRCKSCDRNKDQKRTNGGVDGARMYEMVALLTRTDGRQERIILDTDLREEGETDANLFTEMVLDMKQNNTTLRDMPLVPVYDGRLSAEDSDILQDDGNLIVRKVGNDPGGRIKIRTRHDQNLTLRDGSKAVSDVSVVDGTPALKVYDGDSVEWFVKMNREKIQINKLKNTKKIYTVWRVADHPLAGRFAGAMVRLGHNSSKSERENNRRRSVYMRVCPESSPEHRKISGRREDVESHNSLYKSRLNDNRVRSVGRIRNRLNLLSFMMNENDKAMYAHFWRSGDYDAYDKRFAYRPVRLSEPLLKAA